MIRPNSIVREMTIEIFLCAIYFQCLAQIVLYIYILTYDVVYTYVCTIHTYTKKVEASRK